MSDNPTAHKLIQNLDEILQLSHEILNEINESDISILSQLLMRRGKLIKELEDTNPIKALSQSDSKKEATLFKERLAEINALEPQVQSTLNALHKKLGKKLSATIHDKQLAQLYKISPNPIQSTRSDQA